MEPINSPAFRTSNQSVHFDIVQFLGLPFASVSRQQAIACIRHAATQPTWSYVVTPNAAHLARIGHRNCEIRRIYESARYCFLDSRVVFRVAKLFGLAPPPVITGADLVAALFAEVICPATSICIVGGSNQLIDRLQRIFHVGQVFHLNPRMGFWQDSQQIDQAARFVIRSQADITFLVVGSPQQEILANRVLELGGARGVGVCVGASLEFITGIRKRAPRAIQRLSLEWAFRLCLEPRRMAHRYFIESPQGIGLVLREAFKKQLG